MYKIVVPKNFSAVFDVEKFSGWFFRKRLEKPANGGSGLFSIIVLIKSFFGG